MGSPCHKIPNGWLVDSGAPTFVIWHHSIMRFLTGLHVDVPTGEPMYGLCSCTVVAINKSLWLVH